MLAEIEAGVGRPSTEGESIYAVDPRVKPGVTRMGVHWPNQVDRDML